MNNFFSNKKIIIMVIIIIALVLVAIGGYFFYQDSVKKSLSPVTFGYQSWPGVLPYLIAYEEGFFKQQGLEVKMVKVDSYIKEMEDLASGNLDFIGDIALIDVVRQTSEGKDLKIVLATDYSNGADGIVTKKEIKTFADLKGKKVGVEQGTLSEYLFFDALKKNNLNIKDFIIVNLSAQDAAQAFIRGEVEAAITYEPDLSLAMAKGEGNLLYTSADSPNLIIDVLAFRPIFITENEAKVQAIVKAYAEAMDFITSNPEKAYSIGAKYFNITPAELKTQLAGVKLMSRADNKVALSYKTSLDSLHGSVIHANDFLLSNGAIKNKVDSLEIIDPRFVRNLDN